MPRLTAFQKLNLVIKHMPAHDRLRFIDNLQTHPEHLQAVLDNIELKLKQYSVKDIEDSEYKAIKRVVDSLADEAND